MIVPTTSLPSTVRAVLAEELDDLRNIVAGLSDAELVHASGCQGWRVADLLVHLRFSAEDLLYVLAAPWESVIRTSSGPKSRHRSPGLLGYHC